MRLKPEYDPKKLTNEQLLYKYRDTNVEFEKLMARIDYTQAEYDRLTSLEHLLEEEIFLRMYYGTREGER